LAPVPAKHHVFDGERELHCDPATAIRAGAHYETVPGATLLFVCPMVGLIGNIVSSGDSEYVGGNYNCAKAENSENYQDYIHLLSLPNGSL
jgi:hypothetical protein